MANLSAIAMLSEVDGALLVDKPAGLAVHDVERAIKAHFNLVKTGHGAMLDPGASGVFVMLLGDGTKLSQELLGADGVYEGKIRLGRVTDTCDSHGHVLSEQGAVAVTREALEAAAQAFRGDIYQTAPAFSAVRIAGRPEWEIVPSGKDAGEKLVHVYRFTITDYAAPFVSFTLSCTKGVSARALANDFGRQLGCGASLEELRRTKTGKFMLEGATSLMELMKLDAVGLKNLVIPVFEAGRR